MTKDKLVELYMKWENPDEKSLLLVPFCNQDTWVGKAVGKFAIFCYEAGRKAEREAGKKEGFQRGFQKGQEAGSKQNRICHICSKTNMADVCEECFEKEQEAGRQEERKRIEKDVLTLTTTKFIEGGQKALKQAKSEGFEEGRKAGELKIKKRAMKALDESWNEVMPHHLKELESKAKAEARQALIEDVEKLFDGEMKDMVIHNGHWVVNEYHKRWQAIKKRAGETNG